MEFLQIFALISTFPIIHSAQSLVQLKNNGYEDIVIAINPNIPEDIQIIEKIKGMVTDASTYMLEATKNRVFIKSVSILIPNNWSINSMYGRPKSESYDKADIIIANPFVRGDDPYTLQYGGCGEMGRYIHLTPNFLLNDSLINIYGPREKVFVHEWAQYRWGVFDEYSDDQPYYLSASGDIESTRCSLSMTGVNRENRCDSTQCSLQECKIDPNTGLYVGKCMFYPDMFQAAEESIMYGVLPITMKAFCDHTNHNTEAPNKQNKFCNYQSTWDVIMKSPDMVSASPLTNTNIPPPVISLLQYKDRVVSLVLDVSGSMSGANRINRLYQASEVYIMQIIETGSHLGIVIFSSGATVTSQLVKITDNSKREQLKVLLPTSASGGTNICAGVRKAFEVNKGLDGVTAGTELVLLTDGEDSGISSCFSDVTNSGAIIHTIALGPSADKALEQLADMTGGLKLYASDKLDANGLIDSFGGIVSNSGNQAEQSIQIESTAATVKNSQCLNDFVVIDGTVGKNTIFLVTWNTAIPKITLKDPKGQVFDNNQFVPDQVSKSARLTIPGIAEKGSWEYSLCNTYTADQVIGITVNSRAANSNVPPIVAEAFMNVDKASYPNPMIVYAIVTQGLSPVLGANVKAIIETQNGISHTLDLLDNGAGADIIKNDGIYSKYFTNFNGNGRYNLKVYIQGNGKNSKLAVPTNGAPYSPGVVVNGKIIPNPPRPIPNLQDLALEDFRRTASGGAFTVTNVPSGSLPDVFKPGRITDLDATVEGNQVTLSWTATGDDMDDGTAARYELRLSPDPQELLTNFSMASAVNISSLTPQPAGSEEIFTFTLEDIAVTNGTVIYFALIAFDEADQKSDLSNLGRAVQFVPPPPTPTPVPTTTSDISAIDGYFSCLRYCWNNWNPDCKRKKSKKNL
ncbi:calcium-activated chloride channel regulator 1-like [Spea bombifrons]|uniref:calcium-activated chloride channel regulator 1-like n=1 Tax=Spea bombifrons TaxID=233779 RepID=UPI00234B389C|nr:calcium-activated chloride channel regulator 1-like [Spea bombifrons]